MIILPIEDGLNYASSHVAVMPIMDKNWAIKDQLNAASPLFIIMHFHGNTFQVCNWKHKTSKFWNRVKAMIFFSPTTLWWRQVGCSLVQLVWTNIRTHQSVFSWHDLLQEVGVTADSWVPWSSWLSCWSSCSIANISTGITD